LSLPVRSAHIGREIEVHHPWHPLYGRRVKVRDIVQCAGGRVVHIEANPGVVPVVAEWMLDAAVCSAMESGERRVTLAALRNLDQLLADQRSRGNSSDGSNIAREKRNGQSSKRRSSRSSIVAVDTASDEHDVRCARTPEDERAIARKGNHPSGEPADAGRRHRHAKGA
jgi:hypothetical protein